MRILCKVMATPLVRQYLARHSNASYNVCDIDDWIVLVEEGDGSMTCVGTIHQHTVNTTEISEEEFLEAIS